MSYETDEVRYITDINKNTEILNSRGFWPFYITVLILSRYIIMFTTSLISPSLGTISLTTTNFFHSLITVYAVHWVKGSPFIEATSGKNVDNLTFWEQIDNGKQNTMTRKIFTLIPLVLWFAACVEASWNVNLVIVNGIFTFAAILGKLPFMHGTRILGINAD